MGAALPAVEVFLWPDNVGAWQCWQAVQTQWRQGMAGATGLDYAGVRAYLDEAGLEGDERREVFGCIQAAEHEVLRTLAARRRLEEDRRRRGL